MEVLLFALFFISALIFFIAGKDDFGRKERKPLIKDEEKVAEQVKEEKVAEQVKEEKVTEQGNIESQEELKKES